MERRFKPGDLVWFWHGWIGGSVRSGLVIEEGQGLSSGPTAAFTYLVARGDLGPEWMHENVLSARPEDVEPKQFPHRIYPSMIAQEIVQVQPMPLNKSGLLFYLDEVEKRMREGEGEK